MAWFYVVNYSGSGGSVGTSQFIMENPNLIPIYATSDLTQPILSTIFDANYPASSSLDLDNPNGSESFASTSNMLRGDLYRVLSQNDLADPTPAQTQGHDPSPPPSEWKRVVVAEALHSLGTLSAFAVFILLASYWAHMLRKIDLEAASAHNQNLLAAAGGAPVGRRGAVATGGVRGAIRGGRERTPTRNPGGPAGRDNGGRGRLTPAPRSSPDDGSGAAPSSDSALSNMGPMQTFAVSMSVLLACAAGNILLYSRHCYSSEGLLLYDSAYLMLTSFSLIVTIDTFSGKIREVLLTISNINETTSQSSRILYITITAYIFFITRIILDGASMAIVLLSWLYFRTTVAATLHSIPAAYQRLYLGLYYWPEVIVLLLELVIASAMKQPEAGNGNNADAAHQLTVNERTPLNYAGASGADSHTPLRQTYKGVPTTSGNSYRYNTSAAPPRSTSPLPSGITPRHGNSTVVTPQRAAGGGIASTISSGVNSLLSPQRRPQQQHQGGRNISPVPGSSAVSPQRGAGVSPMRGGTPMRTAASSNKAAYSANRYLILFLMVSKLN